MTSSGTPSQGTASQGTASPTCIRRLQNELRRYETKEKEPFIFISYKENNITELYVIIVGSDETPYRGGFFSFKMDFSTGYPYKPPSVTYLTTNNGKIRFNPNLYSSGKVCLSILGTWSGPGWSAEMSPTTVIMSIASLILNKNPYQNEPGHDNENTPGVFSKYRKYVWTITMDIAIYKELKKEMTQTDIDWKKVNFMIMHFLYNYDYILNSIEVMKREETIANIPFQDGTSVNITRKDTENIDKEMHELYTEITQCKTGKDIMKSLIECQKYFRIEYVESNIGEWVILVDIRGEPVRIRVVFPDNYPDRVPLIYLIGDTRGHKNITKSGIICLDNAIFWKGHTDVLIAEAVHVLTEPNLGVSIEGTITL